MAGDDPVATIARVRDDPPQPTDEALVVRPLFSGIIPPITDPYLQRRYDLTNVAVYYIGYAEVGAVDADAAWTIKRIQFVAGNPVTLQWSPPNSVWNNRLALVYS